MDALALAAAAAGALVLLARPRASRLVPTPSSSPARPVTASRCARTPDVYAAEKLSTLRRWYTGPEGDALRRYLPAITWRGFRADAIPVAAWLGFASNSSGALDDTPGDSFHALGLYGIESTRLPRLLANPTVRAVLGGTPSTWQNVSAQTVMGVVNVLDHYATAMGAQTAPTAGTWPEWVLACQAWSSGPGITARWWRATSATVLAADDATRWAAWVNALSHVPGRSPGTHAWPLYSLLRAAQKWGAGLALANAVGNLPEWFGPAMPAAVQSDLATGACQQ